MAVLIITFFQLPTTQAKRETGSSCPKRWLQLKNCNLKVNGKKYHFTPERLIFRTEASSWIYDLPGTDQISEWQALRIEEIGGKHLIHWYAWNLPRGDGGIQDLRWRVLHAEPDSFQILLDEVVRHRNGNSTDPVTPHGLKAKDGRLRWHVGYRNGDIALDRKPARE